MPEIKKSIQALTDELEALVRRHDVLRYNDELTADVMLRLAVSRHVLTCGTFETQRLLRQLADELRQAVGSDMAG